VIKKIFTSHYRLLSLFMTLLLCSIVIGQSTQLHASPKSKAITGEAIFMAEDDDSPLTVKSQLLLGAFKDVITKELRAQNLDPAIFWKIYDEKFQHSLANERSNKKPGSEDAKQARVKDLEAKDQFFKRHKLQAVISSYVVQEVARSQSNPHIRSMTIEANVNDALLNSLFNAAVGVKSVRSMPSLIIVCEIKSKMHSWSEVAQQAQANLAVNLSKNWTKYFQYNASDVFHRTVSADPTITPDLLNFISPADSGNGHNPSSDILEKLSLTQTDWNNSLLLHIVVDLEHAEYNAALMRHLYHYSANLVVYDLLTNHPIWGQQVKESLKYFIAPSAEALSVELTRTLTELPIAFVPDIKREVAKLPPQNEVAQIKVAAKDATVIDIKKLQELLEQRGVPLYLKSQITSLGTDFYSLEISYSGDKQKYRNLLLSLNNEKLGKQKLISVGIPSTFTSESIPTIHFSKAQ
jgi:hypothetical protein